MIHFVDTPLQYDRERIFRRLHIQPGSYVYDCAAEMFPALCRTLAQRLELLQGYTVPETPVRVGLPEVDGSACQVVCLCSCADGVMDAVRELLERGDYLEGYILNDLCNDALFSASNEMNRRIQADMAARGRRLTRRFSPGEGELPLQCQGLLLSFFREEPRLAHVALTEGSMLTPEKSMCYIFGADEKNPARSVEHDCGQCPNTDCFYRMKESETCFFHQ